MRTLLLASVLASLMGAPLMAQDATNDQDAAVWQMILKATSPDTAATINPVLMTKAACQTAIDGVRDILDDWEKNKGACLNPATGEVFGPSK